MSDALQVIWHDLECGSYDRDLGLWRELAGQYGAPVLDVGAGTGRVALDLARAGHQVLALDLDPVFLAELTARGAGLPVDTVQGDARAFVLGRRFPLVLAPMQTIQLLGGSAGRRGFLAAAREHLAPGGVIAVAIAQELEPFQVRDGLPGPLPDLVEQDGVVYSSLPTAVRAEGDGFVLERRRDVVDPAGTRSSEMDRIRLDTVTADGLEAEAGAAGLQRAGRRTIPATGDYVGSEVVLLRA